MPLSQYERSALVPLSLSPPYSQNVSLYPPFHSITTRSGPGIHHYCLDNYHPFLTGCPPTSPTSVHSSQLPEPSCDGILLTKDLSGSPQWTSMAQLDFPEQLESPQACTRIPEGIAQEASPPYPGNWVRGGSPRKQTKARVVMLDRELPELSDELSHLSLGQHYCPLPPWIPWALFYLWSVGVGLASPLSSPLLPVSMQLL